MATALGHDAGLLTLAAGYENGQVTLSRRASDGATWTLVYTCTVHAQPVLSLQVAPDRAFFVTSGVDAVLAKHPIPGHTDTAAGTGTVITAPLRVVNTKHAGQQGLDIRSDGKVMATGGWDSRGRVYSCKTLKEVAVLKWHDVGCYAAGFARIRPSAASTTSTGTTAMAADRSAARQRDDSAWSSSGEGIRASSASASTMLTARNADTARSGGGGGSSSSSSSLVSVRDRRIMQAREGHWLALGGKDGRVSLWDVF